MTADPQRDWAFGPGTILLIEDDPDIAAAVCAVFGNQDATIEICPTLAEGLAYLAAADRQELDIILLDLGLPDSDGIETIFAVRQVCRDLPIIVMTGEAKEEIAIRALLSGADDYLIKDETYPKLLRRHARFAVERKRESNALKKARDGAEEATKLKDKFVSLVAHDLRTPIGVIKGFADLMLDDDMSAEHRSSVQTIAEQSNELLDLINNLLDLGRLQTGMVCPQKAFYDAFFLIDSVMARIAMDAEKKGVTLENTIEKGIRLFADKRLFSQVMQNLLTNAVKFSQSGDTIRLSAVNEGRVRIAVHDEGVGIDELRRENLFRLEKKVSTTGTAGEVGTGFGLPLSQQIMEAHGGTLRVETQEGAGSTFYAELPAVVPRVLIVEDEALPRDILKAHISSIGAEVVTAENGIEALAILRDDEPPHLVLCDILMPEMDGFGLLKVLAATPEDKRVPVIMVTGDDSMETRDRALKLGAADFTVKPIQPLDLLPRVRRFIA